MIKTTEQDSNYSNLEQMSVSELLEKINQEDQVVPLAVKNALPQIERLVKKIVEQLKNGGRLFYIGAGTSGRLGILDASECPPTYGIEQGIVIGLIAGGDAAIRRAVEFAEDDLNQGWLDLQAFNVSDRDIVVGIAASGGTPYVLGAMTSCKNQGIPTGCVTNNANSRLGETVDYPIEIVVGPEFVTGSTRMKSGTAQKLVLNMLSTATMIQLGRVKGNKMVDMQLSNNKLLHRGTEMLMKNTGISDYEQAKTLLIKHGNVRKAGEAFLKENK